MKKIAIMGASGFVGRNLIKALLEKTEYHILAVANNIDSLEMEDSRLQKVSCDVFDEEKLKQILAGSNTAFYLVHMMNEKGMSFFDKEKKAALIFGKSCRSAGITRVIYLGGLGNESERLSQHLASRHKTGDVLRSYVLEVIEFRASMIIGEGSISFEIVKSLVEKLPIIILPKKSDTLTQPIGISDVLQYLISAIEIKISKSEIVEIGGPKAMSYRDFIKLYTGWLGRSIPIVRVSILPEWIAGSWLYLVTTRENARVGRHMVDSFKNEMIVTNDNAKTLFPDIVPRPIEESFIR